jgi:hypothetical protein
MRRLLAGSVMALSAAAPNAGAQGQSGAGLCRDLDMPFVATEANRLVGDRLQKALSGKTLIYTRPLATAAGFAKNARELRPDGSSVYLCERGASESGPWTACPRFGSQRQAVAGSRDAAVWSIKDRALCVASAAFGAEACFSIHQQGAAFAAKRVSGATAICMQGPIALQ